MPKKKNGGWIMKYPAIEQIIKTMEHADYDYKVEIAEIEAIKKGTKDLTLEQHVKSMIYAQLSNNRPWQPIYDNRNKIDSIFGGYNVTVLKKQNPNYFVKELKNIKCGNRQIQYQMNALKVNIETLERIQTYEGGISKYYRTETLEEVVKSLSQGKYKLKGMGIPLVCEYLKGVGVEIVKPDTLLCRLLGRLGYSQTKPARLLEAIKICKEIGQEYGLTQTEVDTILWQYCAKDKFQLCTDKPNCRICGVTDCPSRI